MRTSTEVLATVLEVGVCGTDREVARFEYGTAPSAEDYLVLGHESPAEVLEVGADVEGLARVKRGDGSPTPIGACGRECRSVEDRRSECSCSSAAALSPRLLVLAMRRTGVIRGVGPAFRWTHVLGRSDRCAARLRLDRPKAAQPLPGEVVS